MIDVLKGVPSVQEYVKDWKLDSGVCILKEEMDLILGKQEMSEVNATSAALNWLSNNAKVIYDRRRANSVVFNKIRNVLRDPNSGYERKRRLIRYPLTK